MSCLEITRSLKFGRWQQQPYIVKTISLCSAPPSIDLNGTALTYRMQFSPILCLATQQILCRYTVGHLKDRSIRLQHSDTSHTVTKIRITLTHRRVVKKSSLPFYICNCLSHISVIVIFTDCFDTY